MHRFASRAIVGAFGLLTTVCVNAADRVVIDTEQKAAAATVAAHNFLLDSGVGFALPLQLQQVTYPPRDLAVNALKALAATTTPAALMALRGVLTLPCEFGGSFTARMGRNRPGVLQLQWLDCVARQYESDPTYRHKLNGPATIELEENSFTTSGLTLLQFGDATTSVTAYTESFSPDSDWQDTRSFNLRMVGMIPLRRDAAIGFYQGDFNYRLTGYWDDATTITTHIQNIPPDTAHYGLRFSIDRAQVSGSFDYDTPYAIRDEDLYVTRGTFAMISSNSVFPRSGTFSLSANDLQLHSLMDFQALIRGTTLYGRADISWPESAGAGCLNGRYVFRTDQLLENWLYNGMIYKSGALNINNTLTSRYSSLHTEAPINYPPAPTGTVRLDVRRVGNFSRDYEWRIPGSALSNVAQCFGF